MLKHQCGDVEAAWRQSLDPSEALRAPGPRWIHGRRLRGSGLRCVACGYATAVNGKIPHVHQDVHDSSDTSGS